VAKTRIRQKKKEEKRGSLGLPPLSPEPGLGAMEFP